MAGFLLLLTIPLTNASGVPNGDLESGTYDGTWVVTGGGSGGTTQPYVATAQAHTGLYSSLMYCRYAVYTTMRTADTVHLSLNDVISLYGCQANTALFKVYCDILKSDLTLIRTAVSTQQGAGFGVWTSEIIVATITQDDLDAAAGDVYLKFYIIHNSDPQASTQVYIDDILINGQPYDSTSKLTMNVKNESGIVIDNAIVSLYNSVQDGTRGSLISSSYVNESGYVEFTVSNDNYYQTETSAIGYLNRTYYTYAITSNSEYNYTLIPDVPLTRSFGGRDVSTGSTIPIKIYGAEYTNTTAALSHTVILKKSVEYAFTFQAEGYQNASVTTSYNGNGSYFAMMYPDAPLDENKTLVTFHIFNGELSVVGTITLNDGQTGQSMPNGGIRSFVVNKSQEYSYSVSAYGHYSRSGKFNVNEPTDIEVEMLQAEDPDGAIDDTFLGQYKAGWDVTWDELNEPIYQTINSGLNPLNGVHSVLVDIYEYENSTFQSITGYINVYGSIVKPFTEDLPAKVQLVLVYGMLITLLLVLMRKL